MFTTMSKIVHVNQNEVAPRKPLLIAFRHKSGPIRNTVVQRPSKLCNRMPRCV